MYVNKNIKDLLLVILGSFIFSGVNAFIISGNLGEGGVTGIAIVLYYAFHISPHHELCSKCATDHCRV